LPEHAPASRIPHEALASLRHRLATLSARHPDRKHLIANAAALYGLSRSTLYRGLRQQPRPKPLHRADRGRPKVAAASDLERWCETIAAMKLRTLNGKGRHLSTASAIRILEEHGVETPDGLIRLPPGRLQSDREPLPAPVGLRPRPHDAGSGGRALPGRAQQRAVALRPQPIRPEAP